MEATTACSKDSPGTMNSDTDEHDSVLELGLGLTLATGAGSHSGGVKFLTAQDLPSVTPHCSSLRRQQQTQGRHLGFQASISGTKRASPATLSSPPSLSQVVGWPPIRSYRMNNLTSQTRATNAEDEKRSGECGNKKMNTKNNANNDGKAKTPAVQENARLGFVKVNMDGVQIGRKVDLNAHSCYESLAKTVEDMFFKPCVDSIREFQSSSKLLDGSSEFVLTYEDKEGDWMLVGDVPFRMFIGTVKRLRIMRTSEANGLAPRSQERNDGPRSKPVCS